MIISRRKTLKKALKGHLMATMKQNRRTVVRQVRRALNASLDFFKQASGNKLNKFGYGRGVDRSATRDSSKGESNGD